MTHYPKKKDAVRLLCFSDLHLGRQLTRLPQELHAEHYSPKAAWAALIAYALSPDSKVDAVVLSGDVIDREEFFFEGYRPLEQGIRQLLQAHIPVIAVAGNHDALVFRKLRQTINSDAFYLLGSGGKWESKTLTLNGRSIRFDGWSFADTHYSKNPFHRYQSDLKAPQYQEIAIGVLHCDFAASIDSHYAPVGLSDFRALPHAAWVLGHIHKPAVLNEKPYVFYCGSPQGLDPSESGEHGAHLLDISETGEVSCLMLPLAALRWEPLPVHLENITEELLESTVVAALTRLHHSISDEHERLRVVACRLILEGRTAAFKKIPQLTKEIMDKVIVSKPTPLGHEIHYFIETLINRAQPDFDLQQLSLSNDPPGILAKRLLLLSADESSKERRQLMSAARQKLSEVNEKSAFFDDVAPPYFSDEAVADTILQAGYEVLDQLLSVHATD